MANVSLPGPRSMPSGGVYNYVGALAVSFSIFGVYLYQGIFAKK